MARPPINGKPMSDAERQRRYRARQAASRDQPRDPGVPLRLVVALVRHHGDGQWRGMRWLSTACDASADALARVLQDMSARPDEYGMRAERRLSRGAEQWRLVS